MAEAISSENRYPELKTKLDAFANALLAVIEKVPAYDMRERNLFLSLVRPWLLLPSVDESVKQAAEPAREIAARAGFPAEEIAAEIRLIFENDKHLRECCGEPLALAFILDDYYIHPATELLLKAVPEKLPELFATFDKLIMDKAPIPESHIHIFSTLHRNQTRSILDH